MSTKIIVAIDEHKKDKILRVLNYLDSSLCMIKLAVLPITLLEENY